MLKQNVVRQGRYSGKLCEFTHYNPANGQVWSDDIEFTETFLDDKTRQKKKRKCFGKWVDSEKVMWEV